MTKLTEVCLIALCGILIPLTFADAELTFSMPEYCKNKNMNFCFNNTNYPTEIIDAVLADIKNFEVAKDNDVGQIEYAYRQGDSLDEQDCLSQSVTDPIYYVVDESGRDRVVVQKAGKFEQRYSVRWCAQEGLMTGRTQHFLAYTVKENKMACENKYITYDFLVLKLNPDLDGKWRMERASVKIPVCCACRYEKD